MARIRLNRRWAKIAQAGDCVYLTNVGIMPVTLTNTSRPLMPGGSALHVSLSAELSACAIAGVTELAVMVTPGLTVGQPEPRAASPSTVAASPS